MRTRLSALALLTAAALSATTAPAWATSDASTARAKTFTFRGMKLKMPADWRVYRDWDSVVVVTGTLCEMPQPFAPDCESFWIFGPTSYTNVGVASGLITYTGKYQFHPFSGVIPCPFNSKLSWIPGEKASSRGLRQVGAGHMAKYTAWPNKCVTKTGRTTSKWTQREWFLPKSKILIVDVWNTHGLPSVLKRATWS
jgi:hypothetical protein